MVMPLLWVGSFSHYEAPWSGGAAAYRYNEFTLDLDWREHLLLSVSWSPDTSRYTGLGRHRWPQRMGL